MISAGRFIGRIHESVVIIRIDKLSCLKLKVLANTRSLKYKGLLYPVDYAGSIHFDDLGFRAPFPLAFRSWSGTSNAKPDSTMSLLYYGYRNQCEPRITILKGSFIQDIDVEDGRFRHPGDLEGPDVRLHHQRLGKRSRDTGTGRRETGDG